jgi:hypothetical protein
MTKKPSCLKGDSLLSDKTSEKTSKTRNLATDKSMKKKIAISGEHALSGGSPNMSAVKKKPVVVTAASNEPSQSVIEGENNSTNATLIGQKAKKPASEMAEKTSSDSDGKNSSYLEPFDEKVLFLADRHKSMTSDVISCLKSNTPFCFLGSEIASYGEHYKEIVIDHLKVKEKIKLLYFDPKFGDDLAAIINKELECIDISLLGALDSSIQRKILIIDNENFAKNLDWELIDSLRLELKVVNIGVFGAAPTLSRDKAKAISVTSNFKNCYFSVLNKVEIKEVHEYVSKNTSNANHLETLNNLLRKEPAEGLSGGKPISGEGEGFWRKLRKFVFRK